MKGKNVFTKQEEMALRQLIRQLELENSVNQDEKKRIRSKMRKIGFYGGDDWNVRGMTEAIFDDLIRIGKIRIV